MKAYYTFIKRFGGHVSRIVFLFLCWITANATTRFVKQNGTGDGSSWILASSNLQAMIDASAPNDEVWVMAGTYKPSAYPTGSTGGTTPRDFAFILKNQVKVYGGFMGNETNLSQRNLALIDSSVLSGDIGVENDNSDNTYHVVISVNDNNTTFLDGFKITKGNANIYGSFLALEAKIIDKYMGGGLYSESSIPNIINCKFDLNNGNHAGGIYNHSSSSLISNCSFTSNSCAGFGGGIWNDQSSPIINNCRFTANNASTGGGIENNGTSSPVISNCSFSLNIGGIGGAIINIDAASPTIFNCIFSNNTAEDGGGIWNQESLVAPTITNCTFYGNTATYDGGGIFNQLESHPTIKNCIFWGNKKRGYSFSSIEGDPTLVIYSNVEGGYTGTGNINQNPLFVNETDPDGADNILGTTDDGLGLQSTSPAINSGDPAITTPTNDITGFARIGIFDMGAIEFNSCRSSIVYVKASATGANNGTSWADAFIDLQSALDNQCYDEIWIAAGTYKPSKDPFGNSFPTNPRDKTFFLQNGKKLYGGFVGNETSLNLRTQEVIAANPSVLSGDIGAVGDYSDNSMHVVMSVSDDINTILDGFTITKGNASNKDEYINIETIDISKGQGGGFIGFYSYPTISNCRFIDNRSVFEAGAFFNQHGSPTVNNCLFSMNDSNRGGAVFGTHASPRFTNCVFSNNTAETAGAVYNWDGSNTTFTNCTFANNDSNGGSGAMLSLDFFVWGPSNPTIKNCIFWGNRMNNLPSDIVGNEAYVSYSNIETGHAGIGNISQNPLFINTSNPDGFALQPCSPSINTGDNTGIIATTDIIGSPRIQYTTIDMGAYESAVVCTPPTGNLRAYTLNCSQIVLQWDDVQGRNEESYELYRSINTPYGPYIAIGQPHANETQWIDNNLNSNTSYYYIIRARFGDGFSEFSPVARANTSGINLKIVSNCATKVVLNWDICSPQREGWIIKATTDFINYFDVGRTDALVGHFEAIHLKPATKYYFVVQPIYSNGYSNWSNGVSVTLPSFPAPSNLKSIYSNGMVTLTWSDNANGCDNEENFVVMKKNLSGVFEDYAVVDNDKPIFIDNNVLQNIENCYLVKARHFHGFAYSINNSCVLANVSIVNTNQIENTSEQGKLAANKIVNDQTSRKINKEIDIDNNALNSFLLFYPNPAINQLNIRAIAPIKGNVEITIFDMIGTMKIQKSYSDFDENSERIFDITDLQSGIYIIKYVYKNSKKVYYHKFIKM